MGNDYLVLIKINASDFDGGVGLTRKTLCGFVENYQTWGLMPLN